MAILLLVIIIVSVVLTYIGILISRKYEGSPPVSLSLAYSIGTIMLLSALVFTITGYGARGDGRVGALVLLCGSVLISFPALVMVRNLFTDAMSDLFVSFLFDSSMVTPHPSDYSKARAKAKNDDIPGALKEFRGYFNDNPKSPAPLFAAATLLECENQPEKAVKYYQEIARTFKDQKVIWAEASLRLASVYKDRLDNVKTSDQILRSVMTRARNLKQGRTACAHLMDRLK